MGLSKDLQRVCGCAKESILESIWSILKTCYLNLIILFENNLIPITGHHENI